MEKRVRETALLLVFPFGSSLLRLFS